MDIAKVVSSRATCCRKKVGAVIVRDEMMLSAGYNGSIKGTPHCTEVGCQMEDGHCIRTIHAEMNALLQAARNGVRIEGAVIFITASPCWSCFKCIANAGIKEIHFGEFYRDKRIFDAAGPAGITLVVPPNPSLYGTPVRHQPVALHVPRVNGPEECGDPETPF